MQILFTIKDFSFFRIPNSDRVSHRFSFKTVIKELLLSNYKDFQTIVPLYLK